MDKRKIYNSIVVDKKEYEKNLLENINKIKFHQVQLRNNNTNEDKITIISQELKEIFPECVKGDDEINYNELVNKLIQAVQVLSKSTKTNYRTKKTNNNKKKVLKG